VDNGLRTVVNDVLCGSGRRRRGCCDADVCAATRRCNKCTSRFTKQFGVAAETKCSLDLDSLDDIDFYDSVACNVYTLIRQTKRFCHSSAATSYAVAVLDHVQPDTLWQ